MLLVDLIAKLVDINEHGKPGKSQVILVKFPDLGIGGYDVTDEVAVEVEEESVTIVAALL
jgi:hypothetical protein